MKIPFFQVDAFTDRPFAGNPAAVCLLQEERSLQWMQQVAMEMNLSETAFLILQGDHWRLRWFTPVVEVSLCGHATLASAHVLFSAGQVGSGGLVKFHTLGGLLTARQQDDWILLDFPTETPWPADIAPGIVKALGAKPVFTGRNRIDYLVEVESEAEVRALRPDMAILASLGERGIIVTAEADRPGYDFVSRYFGPGLGIDEDPVTGSAHCCLGPYWRERLHKTEFVAWQASPRGGVVRVSVNDERVLLGGQAVTVLTGELHV